MHRLLLSLVISATLAGCAAPSAPSPQADGADNKAGAQVSGAMTSPLSDLNLVRAEIPAVLAAAQKNPYAAPADPACAALGSEIQALDAALGADLDTPSTAVNPSLIERGSSAVGDAAISAVRGAAEGLVPYRSWVRRLSGTEKYSREVAASIAAGTIRRAYLKGIGHAGACKAPAAPRT